MRELSYSFKAQRKRGAIGDVPQLFRDFHGFAGLEYVAQISEYSARKPVSLQTHTLYLSAVFLRLCSLPVYQVSRKNTFSLLALVQLL